MRRLVWLTAVLLASACAGPAPGDPLGRLVRSLPAGEHIVYARNLDGEPGAAPEGLVAVVRGADGRLDLRVYESRDGAERLAFHAPGGDAFRNLDLIDVDRDGRRDLVSLWEGGQLTIIEIVARGADGTYRSIFQNAGEEVEIRPEPGGAVTVILTSRTYEEAPGQPPVYESIPYRWDGERFAAAAP